jgi:hypothetical protein
LQTKPQKKSPARGRAGYGHFSLRVKARAIEKLRAPALSDCPAWIRGEYRR